MVKPLNKSLFLFLLGILFFSSAAYCSQSIENISKSASFTVTTDVVHKKVQPFTATIAGFGNSHITEGSGFEPMIFRNKFIATKNSPNKIFVSKNSLTTHDTFREGFLDGATVHIYRIKNKQFKMIRKDTVAAGGMHSSGWLPILRPGQVIAPTTSSLNFHWDGWNRTEATYYFTVRAIDKYGNLSPPAVALKILNPDIKKRGKSKNSNINSFRAKRTLFSNSKTPPAPKKLKGKLADNGVLTLKWDPVKTSNLAGYVVYRSDYPPHEHSGYFLQLHNAASSTKKHIKQGDMIIVSKKVLSTSRKHSLTNRVWNAHDGLHSVTQGLVRYPTDGSSKITWSLMPHKKNTPVEDAGETFLQVELKHNQKQRVGLYNHSGTGQTWYDVLEKKPYRIEAWLRQDGNGKVEFKGSSTQKKRITFNVGKKWKKYVTEFTPSTILSYGIPNDMVLEFTGPSTFHVDNFRVYRADTGFLEYLPREMKEIQSAKLHALRTHAFVQTSLRTYNMDQLTNKAGVISGTKKLNTLPNTLKMMKKAKVQPWFQIEFHMSPTEWLAYIEYMAAPYDPTIDTPQTKPWAYKRYKQGKIEPWTDDFKKIYFELSNETWNGIFSPWVFDAMADSVTKEKYSTGQVYGLYQEYVISIFRSSPYWKSANLDKKFNFVLGGWAAVTHFTENAASTSTSSDIISIGAYNGGWDENEGPPKKDAASFFNVLSQVNQSAIPVAKEYARELSTLQTNRKKKLIIGTYEAGPGYALNGLNNARVTEKQAQEQEHVMKSLAAGTATLDSFLSRAYHGFKIQNFFTFNYGQYWKSHAKWHLGGHAYPSWKLISLFNNEGTGDMLRTETLSVPTTNLKSYSRRKAVKNAPLVGIYATKREDRFNIFVISRKIPNYPLGSDDGYTPVDINLPFSKAKSVTLYRMTGLPEDNNVLSDNVKIDKINISPSKVNKRFILNTATGANERGIPAASTYLYVFEGIH